MDQSQSRARVETFSTGPLSLDLALGGGLPYGRFVEIFGPEQSGKTTLALSCCVSLQASGKRQRCAYIDVEHALDLTYAQEMGLDLAEAGSQAFVSLFGVALKLSLCVHCILAVIYD